MAGLVKSIMMSIVADPGDSRAVLDELAAKGDELRKPWTIALTADTAEAQGAVDDVTRALSDYLDAAVEAENASAHLAEVQSGEGTPAADELTAATDRQAEATVRALDAQIRLLAAEERAAIGAHEEGDAQEEMGTKAELAGRKSEEAGVGAERAWKVAKLAILGVGAAMIYGVVKAAGFQSVMTTLHTEAGVAKSQLGALGNGVLALAGQVGFSPDSLAEALYHAESSFASVGIKGPMAMHLLKIGAEEAQIGQAPLVDTQNALDAAIVAGIPGIRNYSQAAGAMLAIVGSGDMTMTDLAQAMGSGAIAVAKNYGQSIYQVGAALAVFGDNNIRGAKAATDLRMTWQAMLDPIKAGQAELTQIGLTQSQLGDEMTHHGLSAAIHMFIGHLKESKVPMSDWGAMETDIFGKKAGVGIGVLVSQYDRLMSKFPQMSKGAHGFGSAWTATQHTLSQEWKQLEAGGEALATKLGTALLPMAMKIVHGLSDFVEGLERGKAESLSIASVIGVVLAGMAMHKLEDGLKGAVEGFEGLYKGGARVVSMASSLIGRFTAQAAATEELTAAQEEQAVASEEAAVAEGELDVAMDANPIGLVVAAIALLIGAVVLVVTHLRDFKQWGMDAFHWVEHAAEDALHWIGGHWPLLLEILTGPIGLAVGEIVTHWHDVEQWTKDAWHAVEGAVVDAWHAIDSDAIQPIEHAVEDVIHFFGRLGADVAGYIGDAASAVDHGVGDMLRWFEQLPGRILGYVAGFGRLLWHAGGDLLRGLVGGIESMVGDVIHAAADVGKSVLHGIEDVLGIFSPSREARKRGVLTGQGLALGLLDTVPMVDAASRHLAQATLSGYTGGASGPYGSSGGGQVDGVILHLDVSERQLFEFIQQGLLTVKRQRGFRVDTSAGLGLG